MSLEPISECDPILRYHDIVALRHDIVSKVTISDPILAISGPISCTYRVQTVSRHRRYRVFHRYRARYGPDIANNITIYGNHVQKNTTSSPMCLQYHNIRISGTFRCRGVYMMSGTICHLLPVRLRPPPPALARRSDWSSLRICPGAPT